MECSSQYTAGLPCELVRTVQYPVLGRVGPRCSTSSLHTLTHHRHQSTSHDRPRSTPIANHTNTRHGTRVGVTLLTGRRWVVATCALQSSMYPDERTICQRVTPLARGRLSAVRKVVVRAPSASPR